MGSVYISVLLFCKVLQSFFNKRTSNMIGGMINAMRYSAFKQCISALLALGLILFSGIELKTDSMTLLLSFAAGILIVISSVCALYAMKSGMVALVSLFSTAGMIIPCIAGIFLFDIPVKPMQWAGIGVFMLAAYLMIMGSKKTMGNFTLKTLGLLVLVLLADGGTNVIQQMFLRVIPNGNVSLFSFYSFGLIGITFYFMSGIFLRCKGEKAEPLTRSLKWNGVILAALLLVINQLVTITAVLVPPVILSAFVGGGGTVAAAVLAAIVYKEKLTAKSIAGIILGILALLMIKMFE